jgi:peptide/nickel transport system permease protein
MLRFLIARLVGGLMTVAFGMVFVFMLVRLIPGNPIALLLETAGGSPELEASLRRLYGLDAPLHIQFLNWLGALVQGDLGIGILSRQPVLGELTGRIPRTLYLMAGGAAVTLLIAIPMGILAAMNRGRWQDGAAMTTTTLLLAVPQFFFGLVLIIVFAVTLRWLPATGYVDPSVDLGGSLRSMVLPWLTIGLTGSAFIARVLRSSMLDVLSQDYIRTARSHGLSERQVTIRHALRNAALPAVTVIGLQIGYLLGGAIVIEKVFNYPGVGSLIVNSITQRDYPTIQASILFYIVAFVVVNLLTDITYGVLDPRVRRR